MALNAAGHERGQRAGGRDRDERREDGGGRLRLHPGEISRDDRARRLSIFEARHHPCECAIDCWPSQENGKCKHGLHDRQRQENGACSLRMRDDEDRGAKRRKRRHGRERRPQKHHERRKDSESERIGSSHPFQRRDVHAEPLENEEERPQGRGR